MSQILEFLTKWWPMLLAIGGFTTLANRISDKVIAPRWPRVAAVISAVSVDYWLVVREVASFFGLPTEASQKAAVIRASKRPPPPADDPVKHITIPPKGAA